MKQAVYTAVFGGYESLKPQPTAKDSEIPWICFTDDPDLTSEDWNVRVVDPIFPMDSVRSARTIKILGHPSLAEFDEVLWIDNRVELLQTPESILDEWLAASDMAVFSHSYRERLIDEFYEIIREGFDDPTRVYEQLLHYAETSASILDARPLWTGIMARRLTHEVKDAMVHWIAHIYRYSRRDQLSVNLALASLGDRLRVINGDNLISAWHRWPKIRDDASLNRRSSVPRDAFVHAIRAPLSRLAEVEGPIKDKLALLEETARQRDEVVLSLRNQAAQYAQVRASRRVSVKLRLYRWLKRRGLR